MNKISLQPGMEMMICETSRRIIHALQVNGDYGEWSGDNFWPMFSSNGGGF